jgi:riboflavin kinase/FMN adenylyltransferase
VITIDRLGAVPAWIRGAYVAVGNFDGVHLGHGRLVGRLRANAQAAGVPALALTFDPHPAAVLRPGSAPVPLVWTERKVELLRAAGADEVGVFATGPWLLGLTAREFFERVIVGWLAARGMVEGPNFAFGRDRGGDAALLASWCRERGLGFEEVEPTVIDDQLVSSSRIRRCLADGRVDLAHRLLGRAYRLRGTVSPGVGRGAGLGFPTANLDAIESLIPADGVYAAHAWIEGQGPYAAACHIGPNLTFGEHDRKVEAHLLGYSGDLYGRPLALDFLEHLRPTRSFDSRDDLLVQIRSDIERTRAIASPT